ncbi:MAG: hypothetical protein Kow00127_14280 [Bacteroidales bacterium]
MIEINRFPIFTPLAGAEAQALTEKTIPVNFRAGELICKKGTPLTHIYLIEKGYVKIFLESQRREATILKIAQPFDVIGGPGFMTDWRHHFSASALTDVSAFLLETGHLNELLMEYPSMLSHFVRHLNRITIALYEKFEQLLHSNMRERIAAALLYLAGPVFNSNDFILPFSRQELAEMAGITKESAVRVLSEFKEAGWIEVKGKKVTIKDAAKLSELAPSNPN